jgi:hypothetical protein
MSAIQVTDQIRRAQVDDMMLFFHVLDGVI